MNPGNLLRNRYRIEKALAAGGFGETYLAVDLDYPGQPEVVVKHLKPQQSDPQTLEIARRLFESEARVLAELGKNSDRIPTLHAYFEEQGEFYLVQEFIEGQTLTIELKLAGGKLPEAEVIEILQEIFEGLQEVHLNDKIHRDLKPDNIIRRAKDGKLVLIDFGAVKEIRQISHAANNAIPSVTVPIGTKGYMPMEQAMGFPRLASDVYAVGAIGIQCLTGKHPNGLFDEAALTLCWQHLCPVSPGLTKVLEKMVAQHANNRYFDGNEAAKAIVPLAVKVSKLFLNDQKRSTSTSTQLSIPNSPFIVSITSASIQSKVTSTNQATTHLPQQAVLHSPSQIVSSDLVAQVFESKPAISLAKKLEVPNYSTQELSIKVARDGYSPQGRNRRIFLKWLGFGGLGIAGIVTLSRLKNNSETPPPLVKFSHVPQLTKIQFTSVKLDIYGEIVNRPVVNAEIFRENMGNGISLPMVKIPTGKFIMGSPVNEKERNNSESPQHQVTVTEFYLGQTLVTQAQWQSIMGNNPSYFKGDDQLPVDSVNWLQAMDFCQKLSRKTGHAYRLPSEAEWEYACRAGTSTPFAFGQTITPAVANYNGEYVYGNGAKGEYRQKTTLVGSLPANAFGLYDMHGNLWEWCSDEYIDRYENALANISTSASINSRSSDKEKHVLRGGSWLVLPKSCRSASRDWCFRGDFNNYCGFRVVYTPVGT